MILKMFSVFDAKVNAFMSPFFLRTTGEAERAFFNTCRDPESNFFRNPEDYHLYFVGEFDEDTGEVKPVKLANLAKASDAMQER